MLRFILVLIVVFGSNNVLAELVGEGVLDHTVVEYVDDEATTVAIDEVHGSTYGLYRLEFDVVPIGGDMFLKDRTTYGTMVAGVSFEIHNPHGPLPANAGIVTSSISSNWNLEKVGSYFKIPEGEAERFELTVAFRPAISDFYQLTLFGVTLLTEEGDLLTVSVFAEEINTDFIHLNADSTQVAVPVPSGMWLILGGLFSLFRMRKAT